MIKIFNIVLALILSVIFFVPFVIVFIAVKLTSPGPAIHFSKRIGKNNVLFLMPKFRTMRIDTPQVATHLLDGKKFLTPIGAFLRKTSLDEIPQLWSVLKGDMNFVGPRPALFNQDDLMALRTTHKVHTLTPGITGWAQINGRDELSIEEKVRYDVEYLEKRSLLFDLKVILLTGIKVLQRADVSH